MRSIALSKSRKLATISIFSALAIVTDYVMFPLSNVKLMDSIVFVCALTFGLDVGIAVGALTWLVYGSVNPLGSAGGPLLAILIISETVYAFLGYGARRALDSEMTLPVRSLTWGCLGLIGALIYDLNTIITPLLLIGEPLGVAVVSMAGATPFMLAHEISDFAFFAIVAPALYRAILRVARTRDAIPRSAERPAPLNSGEVIPL